VALRRAAATGPVTAVAWYCVYTNPRCEDLAVQHLEDQQFNTMLLTYEKTYKSHRKPIKRPLFPRYLFVEFDIKRDHWQSIFGTYGVHSLFMAGEGVPVEVPARTIELLRTLYVDRPMREGGLPPIEPGTRVRILSDRNPFAHVADPICTWSDGERLKLLFTLFAREFEVMFDRAEVEPVQ
jgi:transcriptional antiterminator RfaH